MAILKRNEVCGYSIRLDRPCNELSACEVGYPFSKVDAPSIVKFLFLMNLRRGWDPPREFCTYLRQAKKLLEEYGEDKLISLIREAAGVSTNPFGLDFVCRLGERDEAETNIARRRSRKVGYAEDIFRRSR